MRNKINNIKVCHLTSVHPPFDIRIFHKECVSLAEYGFQVTLIAPTQKSIEKSGVRVIAVDLPKSRFTRMLVVTFRMLNLALKQNASIYHFHDPELIFCGIFLRLAGKKVVYDIHENVRISIASKDWIPKLFRKTIGFLYSVFESFALLFFNALLLAEDSYRKNYPQSKAVVILNYPIFFDAYIVKEFNKSEAVELVYTGVVHPLRGVWEMLNLLKWLSTQLIVKLTVVGELRPQNLQKEVLQYIVENQLQDSIQLVGKVEYSAVSKYLQKADVGISLLKPIPNYLESLPTKILEYMQYGLPVIGNNFDIIKKYVEQPKTGICIDIENIENDYEKVLSFLQNKSKLEQCAKNGMAQIQNNWQWKTQSVKLLDLYKQLIEN